MGALLDEGQAGDRPTLAIRMKRAAGALCRPWPKGLTSAEVRWVKGRLNT